MQRRTYLGLAATGVIGSVAGCTSAANGSEYPPYPDAETIELSGDGPDTTERFEITQDGPTLVDAEHMGSDNFIVVLDDPDIETDDETNESNESNVTTESTETNESTDEAEPDPVVASVVDAIGPYDGRSLLPVSTGSYVLSVLEADAEWTATIYDLPSYEDGVGIDLPLKRESEQYDVIGPINFGEQTETEFSFSATGPGLHRVFLTDRDGADSLTVAQFNGEDEQTVTRPISGVGYVEILSNRSWTFELST
jgi:hypothetical protein